MRPAAILLGVLAVSSCERGDAPKIEAAPRPALDNAGAKPEPEHDARLLDIARAYRQYTRVAQSPNWAPADCAAMLPPHPEEPRLSETGSSSAHGEKLYFLYASNPRAYTSSDADRKEAPVGQSLVKESFEPIELAKGEPVDLGKVAGKGSHMFKPGRPLGLFVMTKLDPATPNTDEGWVYGVTNPEATEVIASGRLENCMTCHKNALADRQFRKTY